LNPFVSGHDVKTIDSETANDFIQIWSSCTHKWVIGVLPRFCFNLSQFFESNLKTAAEMFWSSRIPCESHTFYCGLIGDVKTETLSDMNQPAKGSIGLAINQAPLLPDCDEERQ